MLRYWQIGLIVVFLGLAFNQALFASQLLNVTVTSMANRYTYNSER